MIRRVLAVTLAVAVVLGAGMIEKSEALEAERADAVAQFAQLAEQVDAANARTEYLAAAVDTASAAQAEREAVLAERPAFVGELAALGAAIEQAKGKIDTASTLAAAISTQNTVLAEKSDPATVQTATATIHALTDKVGTDVAAWQAAQVVLAASGAPAAHYTSSSGEGGYARVRAALDRVGGGGVGLYESSSCAGGSAPACANSGGYIKYRADIASWSDGRLNWAMAHELAHIFQFRVWSTLNAAGAYQSMFGGDPEFLANCMAVVRGYPGSVGCNGEQREWASGIWVGSVR